MAQEGLVLQRGGEELLLRKVPDRFTVQATPDMVARLMQGTTIQAVQGIAPAQLVEFTTNPVALEQIMAQIRALPGVNFVSHVYELETAPGSLVYVTNELTVQFTPAGAGQADAIANALGLSLREPLLGIPNTFIFEVMPLAAANPIKLANQLMRQPTVMTAEPNVVICQQPHYRPSDPLYPRQWYLQHNSNTRDLAPNSHISIEQAWEITRGSRSVVVAIVDDSFALNHPDFKGANKVVAPKDFMDNDLLPLPAGNEGSHGTACAGLAIAEENGIGIVGVAPGCAFMPIRTSSFFDDNTIEAIFDWAVNHDAAVISCSWGPAAVKFNLTLRQQAAITRAATQGRKGKGCVIVFAAGNANRPVSGTVNEQGWVNNTLRGPTQWIAGFAAHPDVIAVSASTSLGKKAAYSNWGTHISVCAPSNNAPPSIWLPQVNSIPTAPAIRSTLRGAGVFTTDQLGAAGYNLAGDYTGEFGGTSSACPIVAGVAALVLSANPNLTAREVRQILEQTADKIIDNDPDPQLGLRYGTYENGGHSQWFGYGKVNAYKAVKAAADRLLPPPQLPPPQPPPPVNPSRESSPTPSRPPLVASNILIPDNAPEGVVIATQVTTIGLVKTIQVTIDLNHTHLGDLSLSLVTPRGEVLLLQGRTLGRQTTLQQTYTPQNAPLLQRAIGKASQGTWYLWIVDHAVQDTGLLNRWQLVITV